MCTVDVKWRNHPVHVFGDLFLPSLKRPGNDDDLLVLHMAPTDQVRVRVRRVVHTPPLGCGKRSKKARCHVDSRGLGHFSGTWPTQRFTAPRAPSRWPTGNTQALLTPESAT